MARDGRRDPRGNPGRLIGTERRVTRPVLLYDVGCRLCRFAARVVVALDRRRSLALLGLEDASADPLLEGVAEEERGSSLRLVLPDGRVLSGGAAARGVLERLPATRLLGRGLRAAGRALYSFVARNRDRLGGFVPDGSRRGATPEVLGARCGPDVDPAVGRVAVDLGELVGREVEVRSSAPTLSSSCCDARWRR